MRIFYAHRATTDIEKLRVQAKASAAYVSNKNPNYTGARSLTYGSTDYENRGKGQGLSFDDWAYSVAWGRNAMTGEYLFNAIIVPNYGDGHVGKATMVIVTEALRRGIPVVVHHYDVTPEGGYTVASSIRVTRVEEEDANDWKSGWVLR